MGSLQDKLHLQRAMQPPPQAPKQPKTAKKKSQAAQNSSESSRDAAPVSSCILPLPLSLETLFACQPNRLTGPAEDTALGTKVGPICLLHHLVVVEQH